MTRSELIGKITDNFPELSVKEIELVVKEIIDQITTALAKKKRVEIRGFGSFSLHYRAARIGRNPKNGETVHLYEKYVPHFKPGKELRQRVNDSLREPECC